MIPSLIVLLTWQLDDVVVVGVALVEPRPHTWVVDIQAVKALSLDRRNVHHPEMQIGAVSFYVVTLTLTQVAVV